MLATWRYRPRDTFIQRLDPRTRLIFLFSVIFGLTIPEILDYRIITPLFALSLTLYFLARIEWKDVWRAWVFILVLVVVIVGVNGVLSGRGGPDSVREVATQILFEVPFFIPGTGWGFSVPITIGKAWFGVVQMTRMLAMAILAVPIPYTMAPDVYGVSFRRMGASDKFSFAMDLAFRFLPTFARDFTTTVDAQRARGYEMEVLKGGIVAKLRRLAPLIIPVTMQATVTGEDVIDAMDLRAFDTNKRTWIKDVELKYAPRDYFMLGLGAFIFVGCCILKWVFGVGGFFVPNFFFTFLGY
jgi:energy-coupling factor transport system permease protein